MDIQTLKVFAERLRAHLATQDLPIKHGHALELVSAIPGLRTWSEVSAFPDRVASSTLNDLALGRLVRRITEKFSRTVSSAVLLQVLSPPTVPSLKVWPDGPVPGVYNLIGNRLPAVFVVPPALVRRLVTLGAVAMTMRHHLVTRTVVERA